MKICPGAARRRRLESELQDMIQYDEYRLKTQALLPQIQDLSYQQS